MERQSLTLTEAVQPSWNTDTERYRNVGNPILMFDVSVHAAFYHQLYDHKVLTHQYQNIANNLNRNNNILCTQEYTTTAI